MSSLCIGMVSPAGEQIVCAFSHSQPERNVFCKCSIREDSISDELLQYETSDYHCSKKKNWLVKALIKNDRHAEGNAEKVHCVELGSNQPLCSIWESMLQ